jgi:V8-like Glu-specific endopeptidase
MTRTFRFACAALVSSIWVTAATAQPTVTANRAKTERQFARVLPVGPVAVAPGAGAAVSPPESGQQLYRIHFAIGGVSGTAWTIEVATASTTRWTSDPLDAATTDLWSDELRPAPKTVTVRLKGPAGQTPPQVSVDRVAVHVTPSKPQAITPPGDQSQPIKDGSPNTKLWGKSVARMQFIGSDGLGYFCTAFLVSPNLMLTNNHCINTDAEMRSAFVEFDYDEAGSHVEKRRFKELVAHDENLDYALLRLKDTSTRAALTLKAIDLAANKDLVIIEHPAGKLKRFSRFDCKVTDTDLPGMGTGQTDFGHFCDTEGGSSGSPIQDLSTGAVLGLHHLGFQPGAGSGIVVNRGVKIGLILSDLAQRNPTVRAEISTP